MGFRVVSSERRWDRGSEAWTDGDRFSAWVSCWRRVGDGVIGAVAKGDPVIVTGRLSVREYEANGERRFSTEIAAAAVGHDLARGGAKARSAEPTPAEDAGAAPTPPAESPAEDPPVDLAA